MRGLFRGAAAPLSYNNNNIIYAIALLGVLTLQSLITPSEAISPSASTPSRWLGAGGKRGGRTSTGRHLPLAAISASMLDQGGVPVPPSSKQPPPEEQRPPSLQEQKTNSSTTTLIFGDKILGKSTRIGGGEACPSIVSTSSSSSSLSEATTASLPGIGMNLPGGIDPRLLKPHPILLAEGSDFRFEFISQCELPTDRGLFHLRAYRYTKNGKQVEPVVLFQGDVHGQRDVLVRVHDQCLTSEVLGSKRCDCKEQLDLAMDKIAAGDGGMIIYLPQEGRGIGLANKIAAYNLQEQGLDTVDANLFLGFGDDERTYDYVPFILKDFGIESICLATNNPFKTRSLRSHGVEVTRIEPLQAPINQHNRHYIRTKILKMEHSMDYLLEGDTDIATTPEAMTDSDKNSTMSEKEALLNEGYDMPIDLSSVTSSTLGVEREIVSATGEARPEYCFGKDTVLAAIKAISEGKMVAVVDDEDRENEGDIIMAADAVTTQAMAFIVRYCSGVVCVAMEEDELDRLALPPMIAQNEDPKMTAFTVSVDYKYNTTTGISAHDRAMTCRMLASVDAVAKDFTRPGHIFPLRYASGGVMTRRGHTEASVDLSKLAGRRPAGILCEICSDDGSMARLPELREFVKRHGLILTSIADLVAYRAETEEGPKVWGRERDSSSSSCQVERDREDDLSDEEEHC